MIDLKIYSIYSLSLRSQHHHHDYDWMDSHEITLRTFAIQSTMMGQWKQFIIIFIACWGSVTIHKTWKRLNEINYNGLTSQWHCDHASIAGQSCRPTTTTTVMMLNYDEFVSRSIVNCCRYNLVSNLNLKRWIRPQSIFNTKCLLIIHEKNKKQKMPHQKNTFLNLAWE